MKRTLCFLFLVIILFTLFGCNDDEIREPITFYYRTKDIQFGTSSDVIAHEIRDQFGHKDDFTYLINEYLQGPKTDACISPFPAGTMLIRLELVKDKAIITLSSHISLLTGPELSIAATCIAKTVHEMTNMKYVQIASEGDLLDGEPYILIECNAYLTSDEFIPSPSGKSGGN